MAALSDRVDFDVSFQFVSTNYKAAMQTRISEPLQTVTQNTSLITEYLQNDAHNTSFREDCITIVYSEMEFLPWDNPDNIVSADVESAFRRIKNNMLVLLFLIGGPANIINMAVFYKQGLQDRVNLCLFALSLADELHLFMAMLHHGEQLHIQFTTKERFGPMSVFLTNINTPVLFIGFSFVSPVLSAIIATERCLCVYRPLKFHNLIRTRTMGIMIVVIHILVLGLFFVVGFRYRVGCFYDPLADKAVVNAFEGEFYKAHKEFIDRLDSFFFGVGLPGAVMIVIITTTMMTIAKLRQAVSWRTGSSSSISPKEVALTKMLVGNSILFIICTSPVALIRFSWLLFPKVNSGRRHHNFWLSGVWVTETSLFMNSTFNIFVYYSMGSRYRETFWALLSRMGKPEKA